MAKDLHEIDDKIKKRREDRAKIYHEKKKTGEKDAFAEGLKEAEKFKAMKEHKIPLEELYLELKTSPEKGVTDEQAKDLNKLHGDNALTEKKKTPWYVKLIHEFISVFAILLWSASILAFVAYALTPTDVSNLVLGIALILVILISGTFDFVQNYKSESIMEGFKNFIPSECHVTRNGESKKIFAAKLVPGDIVDVAEGQKIPADIRIITCSEMRVNNSSLTGESEPLLRVVECTHPDNPLETKNLCFFGTLCAQGRCKAIVLNIGDHTVIGQIANLASAAGSSETPLQREMEHFIYLVAAITVSSGCVFFALGFALGYDALTNMLFAVGIIIGNAPSGLLITVTVALSLCAKVLKTRQVLAKTLQSVETLGSTNTICSDKTGTLTQNRMTIENLWYDGKIIRAYNKQKTERFPKPGQELLYDISSVGFSTLHKTAVVSSEAHFEMGMPADVEEKLALLGAKEKTEGAAKWKAEFDEKLWLERPVNGDASETAIVKFYQPIEDILETRKQWPLVEVNKMPCRVPFNSTNKFALSIVEYPVQDSHYAIIMKGAPERVIKFCTKILIDGQEVPFTEDWKRKYLEANDIFGKGGQRVLGFCKVHLPASKFKPFSDRPFQFNTAVAAKYPEYTEWNFPLANMTFVGLVSLVDPPRDTVPDSINKCRTAGIKVIMVTGDQPVTAQAIARQVNILDPFTKTNIELQEELGLSAEEAILRSEAVVIHGDLITKACKEDDMLPESEKGRTLAYWLSKKQIVFARTSPAQKLIIVKGCQSKGEVVAVTGDGVNDSPAIKKADVGVAMGQTGSDIAKDAADLVLLTDDFSALVIGIEEGRRIFDNLKKCISYSMTVNIPCLIPFILLIFGRIPIPVNTILLLLVNIGTDMLPAISLAYERAELDIMTRKPRSRHEHLVTRKLMTFCYLQMGEFESFGTWMIYFILMANFGFPMSQLFGMGLQTGYRVPAGSVYDPTDPYFGNSNLHGACANGVDGLATGAAPYSGYNYTPDWIYSGDQTTDLRMSYVQCGRDASGQLTGALASTIAWGTCTVNQISSTTGLPICFTPESIKYTQTAFFHGFVFGQIANLLSHKGRRTSVYFQGLSNYFQSFAISFEVCLLFIVTYIPGLNYILGTRDLQFLHFGMPALPFVLFILFYEEMRKILVNRSLEVPRGEKPGWWYRNYAW
jgi:sodium/potassium-transporting ATPase subunit alpha